MKTLVVANRKGGVGKSAIATMLSHYLVQDERRVLAIDLSTCGDFGRALRRSGRTSLAPFRASAMFESDMPASPAGGFALVQSNWGLADMEQRPDRHRDYVRGLRRFLDSVATDFDACVIDTHSMPDIAHAAALACAHVVLVPAQLHADGMAGLSRVLDDDHAGVRLLGASADSPLEQVRILPNLVESTGYERANFQRLVQQYGSLLLPHPSDARKYATLPRRSMVSEAQFEGRVLWEMKNAGARDAARLIKAVIGTVAALITSREVRP